MYLKLLACWHLIVSAYRRVRYLILRALYVGAYRFWRWIGWKMLNNDSLFRAQIETGISFWTLMETLPGQHIGSYVDHLFNDPRYDRDI